MLDEKGSASALEHSEAATMFQGGERLLPEDLLRACHHNRMPAKFFNISRAH